MGVLLYPYSVVALRLKTSQFFALFVKERCFDNPLHLIHFDFFNLPNPIPIKSFFKGTVSLEVLLYIVYEVAHITLQVKDRKERIGTNMKFGHLHLEPD